MAWDNTTVSSYRIVGPIETETRWPDPWAARDAVLTASQRPEPLGGSLDILPRHARASDLLHGDAGAPGGGGGGEQPPGPDQPGKKKKDPPSTKKKKVTLVDLVEVVTRSAEGVVGGAAYSSSKLKTIVTRSDQNGGAYKQFINLKKDLEGAAKRHPEYENYIEFRARVVCEGVPLSGHPVKFSYEMTDGPQRPAKLAGHGFSGGKTIKAQTDGEGWTSVVRFTLSSYAGDQFKISAEADEDAGNIMRTAPYEVWRKFWYQVSRAKDHAIAEPSFSIRAFRKVSADMLATPEVEFTKASAPSVPTPSPSRATPLNVCVVLSATFTVSVAVPATPDSFSTTPPPTRARTRPVAGADYWEKGALRSYIGRRVVRAVLIQNEKAFAIYAAAQKVDWRKITSEP